MSQPCTSWPSVFQVILLASPQADLTPTLRCVSCFQSPSGPDQSSGGELRLVRTMAEVLPSLATESVGPQPPALIRSGPRQSCSALRVPGSRRAMAESPPAYSAKRIFPCLVQVNQLGEVLLLGVRFSGSPPVALME